MKVLVVDDSSAMRAILTRMLKELGATVTQAGDGIEAVGRLDAGDRPDFVLLDWNMPHMDGLSCVQAIRARPELRDVRIVMVTTETEMEQVRAALDAGADEYVMKPFTPEILVAKLSLLGVLGE